MLSRFFIQRPKFALVISIILTLAGAISLAILPVAEYPQISPPSVSVTAYYTGASAEVVEQAIADPIETSVNGVENMIYMSSKSANDGSYSLNVTFDVGTDPDMAQVNVQNRVSQIESKLPQEVRMVGVTVKKRSPDLLMVLNFYSPDGKYDDQFLINYINLNVKDQLARAKGISEVNVIGGGEYAMRVWLDPEKNGQPQANDIGCICCFSGAKRSGCCWPCWCRAVQQPARSAVQPSDERSLRKCERV